MAISQSSEGENERYLIKITSMYVLIEYRFQLIERNSLNKNNRIRIDTNFLNPSNLNDEPIGAKNIRFVDNTKMLFL